MKWGPFTPGVPQHELKARFRALRALALVFARSHASIHDVLWRAEKDPTPKRIELAEKIFEHDLTALSKRRILATYADLVRYDGRPGDPKP